MAAATRALGDRHPHPVGLARLSTSDSNRSREGAADRVVSSRCWRAGCTEVARNTACGFDDGVRDRALAAASQDALPRADDADGSDRLGVPVEDGCSDARLAKDGLFLLERVSSLARRTQLAI